jgi:ribonuclease R
LASNAAKSSQSTAGKNTQLSPEVQSWQAAGLHCSANERRADEASRDVEAWLKCQYMREHLGEDFSGTVSAVTGFGVFVTLDAMYVEGLVHITELGGDYFRFDEARQELRGERTGIRYAIGARVRVQVSRVDLDGRKIDFRWVQDDATELPSSTRKIKGKNADEKIASVKSHHATPRHKASKKPRNAKVAFATPAKTGKKNAAPKKARKR